MVYNPNFGMGVPLPVSQAVLSQDNIRQEAQRKADAERAAYEREMQAWRELYGPGPREKKPSVLQFMLATGASRDEASDAINKYNNWSLYMPDWDSDTDYTTDASAAQRQIQEELDSGLRGYIEELSSPLIGGRRTIDRISIGGTGAFQPLNGPMPGAVGGQILPDFFYDPGGRFHDNLRSFAMMRPDGTLATPIQLHSRNHGDGPSVTKDLFARDAYGYGLGQDALDSFAQKMGADDWNALDWGAVEELKHRPDPLKRSDWISQHGVESTWRHHKDIFDANRPPPPPPRPTFQPTDYMGEAMKQIEQMNQNSQLYSDAHNRFAMGGNYGGGVLDEQNASRYSAPFGGALGPGFNPANPVGTMGWGQQNSWGLPGGWGAWSNPSQYTPQQGQAGGWGGPWGASNPWSPSR